ncbi:hypothetical protein C2857_007756 [Epichloe festucae Fl1]|uniref:MARVEL domain-containing protein n=1 Tax=Epichloe festucae (strain Fl1) TaxID=877507 RepID=A0A7S9KMS0_EPIFF|nr:hypothetical protein C2857_007756 [Epichloe festucae Fl1]
METAATEKHSTSSHVLETPIWITVIRGFQFFLSLVVLGLAGRLMHDLYLDEFGLAVATAIITWAILFYVISTEKITSWQKAYHVIAVLVLEAFLVILWLATFAAAAARRASFTVPARVSGCFDDGSAVNSKICFRKREIEKRAYLFESGQAMFSAIAGLGALVWLLFIATFVYTLVMFSRGRKEGRFPFGSASSTGNTYQMEPKIEQAAPVMMQQQQQPIQPQQTGEYQPPLDQNPPQNGSPPAQNLYQQQPAYQAPQDQQPHNNQHHPQEYQQDSGYQQHVYRGSELSSVTPQPQQQYTAPSPATASPLPQQYYPQ